MSFLSLISWTDRDVTLVATRIRSAYSSVSKRETSFSRIALDSVMDINDSSIRFSILILADREDGARFRQSDPITRSGAGPLSVPRRTNPRRARTTPGEASDRRGPRKL